VEPGVYREGVDLRDGPDLAARVPGSVTILHPGDPRVPALSLTGPSNVRVTGIRVDAESPADVAIRIGAPSATLELVEIAGQFRRAIDLSSASSVTLRGGRIAIPGTLLTLSDDGHATFVNSVLVNTGTAAAPAVSSNPLAHLVLRGNVFAGFSADVIDGVSPARRAELLAGNIVVPAERPAPAGRGAARPRASGGGR
jgi:hypothetical protein